MATRTSKGAGSVGLTPKALILGILLVVINTYWINTFYGGILHSYQSLFSNSAFTLFAVLLVNMLVQRVAPRLALTAAETLAIYIMVLAPPMVSNATHIGYLVTMIPHPFWFANTDNDWANLFLAHIPDWMAVQDEGALRRYYAGESSFLEWQNLRAWLLPLGVWSAFLMVLWFVMMCMNAVLRRQFSEYERLTYPITWLPLDMAREPTKFFTNRLMWLGFGLAMGGELWNGVSALHPSLPSLPIRALDNRITHLFSEKPWNAVGTVLLALHPFAIGLSFFMPLDLAFSSLFFFLFGKVMLVLRAASGMQLEFYLNEQSEGAWIGLGLVALWLGRRHIRHAWRRAFVSKDELDDSMEPMSYRTAFLGMIIGIVLLGLFSAKAGLSPWAFAVFFGLYFLMAIGLTKVRAGLGPPMHEVIFKDPAGTMVAALGTRAIGPRNLTIISYYYWLNRVNTAHPMPNQAEAYRIGEQTRMNGRKLVIAMIVSLAVSVVVAWYAYLGQSYDRGAGIGGGGIAWECFNRLDRWLKLPTEHNIGAVIAMGVGFAATLALSAMKTRFLWWPFHPIGYVIGTGAWGDMSFIWLPVLIGWTLKGILLRAGGLQAYRQARPFFAGLILGDFSAGCLLSIVGLVWRRTMYWIWV